MGKKITHKGSISEIDALIISIVISSAAKTYGVPVAGIRYGRNEMSCDARKGAVYFLRTVIDMKWKIIASAFGPRYQTLIYHYQKHPHLMVTDPDYNRRYNMMVVNLKEGLQQIEDNKNGTGKITN